MLGEAMALKRAQRGTFFWPDPPLASRAWSAPRHGLDPDCRAGWLLCQLTLPAALTRVRFAKEPPLGAFVPSGPKPLASGSAVGVFAADHACAPGILPVPLARGAGPPAAALANINLGEYAGRCAAGRGGAPRMIDGRSCGAHNVRTVCTVYTHLPAFSFYQPPSSVKDVALGEGSQGPLRGLLDLEGIRLEI